MDSHHYHFHPPFPEGIGDLISPGRSGREARNADQIDFLSEAEKNGALHDLSLFYTLTSSKYQSKKCQGGFQSFLSAPFSLCFSASKVTPFPPLAGQAVNTHPFQPLVYTDFIIRTQIFEPQTVP